MSQREIEIAKEKFEKIDCNKNGFINFEQLTARINVFSGYVQLEREVGKNEKLESFKLESLKLESLKFENFC